MVKEMKLIIICYYHMYVIIICIFKNVRRLQDVKMWITGKCISCFAKISGDSLIQSNRKIMRVDSTLPQENLG